MMRKFVFGVLLSCCMLASSVMAKEGFAVISHSGVVLKKLNRETLLQIFLMRRVVDDKGAPLQLYSLETDQPAFYRFISECLLWNPAVLARTWRRNLFTGEGPVPVFVEGWQAMQQAVAHTPGAIGYLPEVKVTSQVKVLWRCK